jgi:hypothetical protein
MARLPTPGGDIDAWATILNDYLSVAHNADGSPKIPYGTSLPAAPVDGQEAILVDSLTNPSYTWRFRYHAGSTSGFKWEFVGGAPLLGWSSGNVTNGGTLNAWLNVVAATLNVPRSGDYRIAGSGTVTHPTAGASSYLGIYVGSTANVPGYAQFGFPVAGGYAGTISVPRLRVNGIQAGQPVGLAGMSNLANGNFSSHGWEILPIRVS